MRNGHKSKRSSIVPSTHPMVGTWIQEENPFHRTSAVFKVAVKDGNFLVTGVDESDGTVFEISGIIWDGKALRFLSIFPPTKHKAQHAFRLVGKDRIKHRVSHTYEGETCSDDEKWIKRPGECGRSA